jgi:membrane protease YdiL (CAAX protease family)
MGLVFGYLYQRVGRVMPLVVAHFLLDAAIFVGYSALKDVLTFL